MKTSTEREYDNEKISFKKASVLSTLMITMMGGAAQDATATSGLGALDALPKELHGEIRKYYGSLSALDNQKISAYHLNEANIDIYKRLTKLAESWIVVMRRP